MSKLDDICDIQEEIVEYDVKVEELKDSLSGDDTLTEAQWEELHAILTELSASITKVARHAKGIKDKLEGAK